MPPKPKSKKTGLSDKQLQTTVEIVKQYWPDYDITVENIRNPTRPFILKFYSDVVDNLEEKCAFVTRTNLKSYPPGLSEEELLFLKLSRIPSLIDSDFKLGDLFVFDSKRVNLHMFVTMYFLISTESVMDRMVEICNRVFDIKENIARKKEELNRIKEEKTLKRIQLTEAKTKNMKLKEEASIIAPKYEDALALMEELDKKHKEKVLQAEKLKSELEIQQKEIQKYEKIELQLKEKIVTEDEYNHLKNTLESLKKEEESLEEIDIGNGLFEQKEHIKQLQQCLQELNYLNVPEDLCHLSDLRVQLKNEQQNLEHTLSLQQSGEAGLKQLKKQLEIQEQKVKLERKKLQETLKKTMENILLEENAMKKKYQHTFESNERKIEDLKKTLEHYNAEYNRMKKGILSEYNSVCNKGHRAVERVKLFLSRVKEVLGNEGVLTVL